ncbi:uncharacterized protein LOC112563839 isoform X2 [Pomacea canaliculata]|uniref:uncharacterized protein LOC112563839 isoform X2 n=1 Tax=Pomacea canaliculata TaxID=400727 RepID=UPI000D72DE1E|nr:uncharacterized protein LOC112563839 isoform X2 [Pomacea canaliculata]
MVDQMRNMLVQAAHTKEETQKTVALQNFEKVYSQAMKLQVQMNNLRVSQLERNKEIMLIKRQLLLQEVNNVLLQAHITRREVELYQYREARRHAAVKRWSTFSTSDRAGRSQSGPEFRPPLLRNNSLRESDQPLVSTTAKAKHDIPLTSDKEIRVPALGVKVENGEVRTAFELYPFEAAPKDSRGQVERHQASSGSAHTPAEPSCFTPTVVQQMDSTHASPLTSTTQAGDTAAGAGQRAAVTSRPQDVLPHPSGPGIGKVAKGSPTLLSRKNDRNVIPSGNNELYALETETPRALIPQRPEAGEDDPSSASSALVVDETYSPTKTVMECTDSALDAGHLHGTSTEGTGDVGISSSKHQPKPVRRSVQQQKHFRQQKEEKDNDDPGRKATGKPPLPRQSTPQSPPTSKRSKSVGDVDGAMAEDAGGERLPARDVMSRLEKCATVCETEERKLEFRKTPSPTLHLPRVGLVSRVRRLKPAAELLQESQRYRSGHTVYATRIMQRYLPPPPAKPPPPGGTTAQGKENVSGQGYVQAIVQRLSREGTPARSLGSSSTNSSLSLSFQRTDSPKACSEFVSHVVQKLSSSGGPEPHKPHKTPLKDLSNEGQVKQLTHVFSADDACAPGEHQLLDTDGLDRMGSGEDGGESLTATLPPSVSRLHALLEAKPDSTISPTSHASMPSLSSDTAAPLPVDVGRARAATYSVKEAERPRSLQQQSVNGESIELIGEDLLHPRLTPEEGDSQKISPSSSTKSKNALCCQSSSCTKSKCSSTDSTKVKLSSPKSQERRGGTERKETIGVLCKQSMSFDLGVSLKAQPTEAGTCVSSETEAHGKGGGSSGKDLGYVGGHRVLMEKGQALLHPPMMTRRSLATGFWTPAGYRSRKSFSKFRSETK